MTTREDNLYLIRQIADKHEWQEIDHQQNIYMVSFKREKTRLNVYYSTMTVATALDHPKHGKSQLYRRNITPDELEKIMEWPRVHSGRGYFTNKERAEIERKREA